MDKEQLEALFEEIIARLQNGEDPTQLMQYVMEKGLDQAQAQQLVEEAIKAIEGQQGGQAQGGQEQAQGQATGSGRGGGAMTGDNPVGTIDAVVGELGATIVYALLDSYTRLSSEEQTTKMNELQQLSSEEQQAGQGSPTENPEGSTDRGL